MDGLQPAKNDIVTEYDIFLLRTKYSDLENFNIKKANFDLLELFEQFIRVNLTCKEKKHANEIIMQRAQIMTDNIVEQIKILEDRWASLSIMARKLTIESQINLYKSNLELLSPDNLEYHKNLNAIKGLKDENKRLIERQKIKKNWNRPNQSILALRHMRNW